MNSFFKLLQTRGWGFISVGILFVGAGWTWMSRVEPGETTAGLIPAPQVGFLAPDFSLQTLEGETITLSDLRGKAVLVNLWASWCPPCRAEMPAMQRVYEEYQNQGFEILAVNATNQDSVEAAMAFGLDYGLNFPLLLDMDGVVSKAYNLRALPSSFFIGRDGVIREVVVGGPMAEALLRVRVEQLLAEAP